MSLGVVVVFGREPVAGLVKTRLATGIGEEAASAVYAALLEHTLKVATASGLRVIMALAEPASKVWTGFEGVDIEVQTGGDLGNRMAGAFARRFSGGEERAVVIGSDCPWVTVEGLLRAVTALERTEVVLGPADDGGYWLVAQRRPGVDLFSSIRWSSNDTLEQTRRRLERLGQSWIELEELIDIDTGEDLDRVLADPRTPTHLRERLQKARFGRP